MVVDMLSSDDRCNGVALLNAAFGASVLELQTLLLEAGFDCFRVAVLMFTVLNRNDVVLVFFWEHFTVFDWLD
jgi:hypothetical protein